MVKSNNSYIDNITQSIGLLAVGSESSKWFNMLLSSLLCEGSGKKRGHPQSSKSPQHLSSAKRYGIFSFGTDILSKLPSRYSPPLMRGGPSWFIISSVPNWSIRSLSTFALKLPKLKKGLTLQFTWNVRMSTFLLCWIDSRWCKRSSELHKFLLCSCVDACSHQVFHWRFLSVICLNGSLRQNFVMRVKGVISPEDKK